VNNKIKAIKNKINHWTGQVVRGRIGMFSELSDFLEKNELSQSVVKQSINRVIFLIFLNGLINTFSKTQDHHWILSPFTVSNTHHLSSDLIEALDDLSK